jgi:hypothetical protein
MILCAVVCSPQRTMKKARLHASRQRALLLTAEKAAVLWVEEQLTAVACLADVTECLTAVVGASSLVC